MTTREKAPGDFEIDVVCALLGFPFHQHCAYVRETPRRPRSLPTPGRSRTTRNNRFDGSVGLVVDLPRDGQEVLEAAPDELLAPMPRPGGEGLIGPGDPSVRLGRNVFTTMRPMGRSPPSRRGCAGAPVSGSRPR
jgi:hypothetical protein